MTFRNIQVVLSGNKTNLSSTLYAAANEVDRFHGKVESGNQKAASSAKLMGAAFLAAGAAVALGLGYGVAKAAEFDKSMRNVNSLLQLTDKQFAALEGRVISLSTKLPQSANTLAEGLYDIAGSGFAGADGLTVLEASAAAASAGMTDTATSAKAITAVLNAYGRGAGDAADVSDVLFKTVDQGVIGFGELSGVIGDTVGTAAAAKVGIDQVGSAIATMTLTGISGSEAGTSLNRVLQSVISPSEKLATLLDQLGYESGAAALEQDGLRGVMEKVREATGGNITELLQLFPEIRAARGALALMAAEGKNYARVSAQIEDAERRQGATQKALNEQMRAVSNQWTLFKNKIDAAAISGGTKLLPVLTQLMSVAGELGSAISDGAGWASEQLAPTWESLAEIGQDLWEIATNLGEVFGPIAVGMAAIVAVPLFATLNMVAQGISTVTDFLAEHEEVVLAAAAAWGILKVQAYLAAAGGARVVAWKAASAALVGLAGSIDATSAAYARMRIAQAAATLGASALIAGAITSWMSYRDVVGKVADAVDDANGAIKDGTLEGLNEQKRALQETRAELEATIKSYTDASFIGRFWQNFSGGASAAVAASNALDEVDAAIGRVDTSSTRAQANIARYLQESMGPQAWAELLSNADLTDQKFQEIAQHVVEGGGKVNGSYAGMVAALTRYGSAHNPVVNAEKQLVTAMGELANGAEDAEGAVQDLKGALDALIGGPLSQERALLDWEEALDNLTASIKENGTSLDANTEKGRANRRAIADSVEKLKDRIQTDAEAGVSADKLGARMQRGARRIAETAVAAGMSEKAVKNLVRQYGLTPEMVKTVVEAAGAAKAKEQVEALQWAIDTLKDKTVNVTTKMTTVGVGPLANKQIPQAYGGIWLEQYAAGGARLPKSAMIAKNGANLVQWAEPGTGGEAFIPLAQDRRARSTAILASVADMFGMVLLQRFAGGGVRPAGATGTASSVSKIVAGTSGTDTSAELAKAAREVERLVKAYQDLQAVQGMNAKERRKYAAEQKIAAGQERLAIRQSIAANREQWAFDHLSTTDQIANLTKRMAHTKRFTDEWMQLAQQREALQTAERDRIAAIAEEEARLAAEHAQMLADNRAAWEFEHMSSEQQIADIDRRLAATETYSDRWLELMRQREQVLGDIAEAARAAEEALVSLSKLQTELSADVAGRQQWNADLVQLAKSGHADLAAYFSGLGYSADNAKLAREAATTTDQNRLRAIGSLVQAQGQASDPRLAEALALAGVLGGSTRMLGIVGLAGASGKSIGDVVGLLESYWSQIFAGMPRAAQVAADRALISAGQQPSGLARGGIVASAQTGLHYRWAEPGTGGESLIPLGQRDRSRARDLWAETGRMLGIQPTGGGTRSNSIVVAPGAVKVDVSVSGTNLTAADVTAAARTATSEAVNDLVRKLKAGAR